MIDETIVAHNEASIEVVTLPLPEQEPPLVEIHTETRDDEASGLDSEAELSTEDFVEIDSDQPSSEQPEQPEDPTFASPGPVMPPAPFVNPASPSLGDEAGMEALWVEELVTPSPTGEASPKPARRSSFFKKRMGTGLFKRDSEKPSRKKKLHTSVKLLVDEEEAEPSLELPAGPDKPVDAADGRDAPPTTGPTVRVQVQTGTRRPSVQSMHSRNGKISTSKQIALKSTNARELLAMALHPETDASRKQGLAQAAFSEATLARLMMEGENPPKGLDLVLRAASHKGRSAALAASLSPNNSEQVSRAKHYMDLILPVKTFPIVAKDHVAPHRGDKSVGEMSSLGFNTPRPVATAVPESNDGTNTSPISVSSLNEILDGPEEEEKEPLREKTKARFAFIKNFSPKTKKDPPAEMISREMQYQEMPPPEDAPSMDENGSWTDVSLHDAMEPRSSTAVAAKENSRKTKRVFRLSRISGRRGAAASSNGSTQSDKLGWLRRKSNRSATPIVDQVPTEPPNVPYESKPYQRYIANVQVENGSRRSGNTKDLSTVVKRTHQVEMETQDRLKSAILADNTENITSFDGVRMFGQNGKKDDDDEEMEDIPEEELEYEDLPKRSIKVDPQFVLAPAGHASILTAKSWDSLVEDGAARLADAPQAIVQALLDSTDMEDEEIPPPVSSYHSDPPEYMPSASPLSVESKIPGLNDKYSSAEEPGVGDKYSMEEIDENNLVVSPAAESRSDSLDEREGDASPRRRILPSGFLARMQSRRKSHEKEEERDEYEEEAVTYEEKEIEVPAPVETPKSRRKMNLFKKFQSRKKNRDEVQEEEDRGSFPVEEIEYKEVPFGDINMQQTGSTTLTDADTEPIESAQNYETTTDDMDLKVVKSEDTADSFLRRIRNQVGRSKSGKDPVTSNMVEVPRGIDP